MLRSKIITRGRRRVGRCRHLHKIDATSWADKRVLQVWCMDCDRRLT